MTLYILALLAGAALIALVQFDIVATVLHPEVRSPLSSGFQRAIWRVK